MRCGARRAVEFSRRAEGQAYSGLLQPWGHAGGCARSAGREVRARGPRRGAACLYFPKKESTVSFLSISSLLAQFIVIAVHSLRVTRDQRLASARLACSRLEQLSTSEQRAANALIRSNTASFGQRG